MSATTLRLETIEPRMVAAGDPVPDHQDEDVEDVDRPGEPEGERAGDEATGETFRGTMGGGHGIRNYRARRRLRFGAGCASPKVALRRTSIVRAMSGLKTSVTELPESRVRVEAEVAPEEVERSLAQAARELGRQMRIPGFRKGKVPPPVVIRRLGREAVLDEALRRSLGRWYSDALDEAGIAPIGEPDLDVGELPGQGQPLAFSIEIGVRPRAKLGQYKGLEVGRREPQVEERQIGEEIERLRERLATLENVERPAENGDHVVMDYVGSIDGEKLQGGEGRDRLL